MDWPDEEKEIVFRVYPTEGAVGCRRAGVNRSRAAITSFATRFGIRMVERKYNSFEEWEKTIIIEFYPTEGAAGCQSRGINRPISKICDKAGKMNIDRILINKDGSARAKGMSDEEKEIILKYYQDEGPKGVQKRMESSLRRINDFARDHGLVYAPPSLIGKVINNMEVFRETQMPKMVTLRCTRCGATRGPIKRCLFVGGNIKCSLCDCRIKPIITDSGEIPVNRPKPPAITKEFIATVADAYSGRTSKLLRIGG